MRSVELFAGAGGLAIGMSNAGFHHAAVIERDQFVLLPSAHQSPDLIVLFRLHQLIHQCRRGRESNPPFLPACSHAQSRC